MGASQRGTIVEDSLSAISFNVMTWGAGCVGTYYTYCAGPAVPVKCAVAEIVKSVK